MAAPARPRWKPNKEEQADLDAMNAASARIKLHVPSDPYYLEIPQENSARHVPHPSQRNLWLRDTPFGRSEKESLQYQTFHFYEQGIEITEQHSTRLDAPVSSRPTTVRAGTPSTGPKTKISLAAYKKKQNAAMTTPELNAQKVGDAPAKQAAVKGPVERAKAETEEMLAAVAESELEMPVVKKKEAPAPVNDLKRKRDEREQRERVDERNSKAPADEVEPAAKKAKALAGKAVERSGVQNGQQERNSRAGAIAKVDAGSKTSKPDEQQLPPRLSPQLSPLLPDRLSPLPEAHSTAMYLPPRLSPSIPINISKTLESQIETPSTSQQSLPPAADTTSKDKGATLTPAKKEAEKPAKHKSPLPPRNGFRANSNSPAVRSETEERLRSVTSAPPPKRVLPSQDDDDDAPTAKKAKVLDPSSDPPILQKPRLLLKLKYRKSQASAIQRILKMRVSPDKSTIAPSAAAPAQAAEEPKAVPVERPAEKPVEKRNGERKDGNGAVKGVAQKVGPVKKEKKAEKQPSAEKRPPTEKPSVPRPETPLPADKRPVAEKPSPAERQPIAEKRPLPEEERHDSPAKRTKGEVSATRKEPSTPAQQVIESPSGSKSQTNATPSARNNLLAVAMARDRSQDSNSTQTPPGNANTPTISSTSQPNGIARPPSSQPSKKTPRQQAWMTEMQQYEKLARELKHTATAHENNRLPNSAASLIDRKFAAVKSIESFLCFLLAFSCLDESRLAAEPRLPPDIKTWKTLLGFQGFVKHKTAEFPALSGLTSALHIVFASRVLEIYTQYPNLEGVTRESLLELQGLLVKSGNEADAKFDVDVLQDAFPKTWSQRSRKGLPAKEKLEPGKLSGPYKLPIGVATTPVRAVRAGCAILREWMDGEEIDYSLKIKLG